MSPYRARELVDMQRLEELPQPYFTNVGYNIKKETVNILCTKSILGSFSPCIAKWSKTMRRSSGSCDVKEPTTATRSTHMMRREFNELVNMSPDELKEWLGGEKSAGAGWAKDDGSGESIGHER